VLRYKQNGDMISLVAENISSGYDSSIDPIQQMSDSNYDMMFNDAESNCGRRDNILNPES